jgi:hypothetical protein
MKTAKELDQYCKQLSSDFNTLSESRDKNPNKKAKRILKDRMIMIAERLRRAGIDRLLAQRAEGLLNYQNKVVAQ